MDTWLVVVLVVVILLVLVAAVMGWRRRRQRRAHLQQRFGPEYERAVQDADNRRAAERDLRERERQREQLDVRPLSPTAQQRYVEQWANVQGRFVDRPELAVAEADHLVTAVMAERGYPTDGFDTQARVLSVDHAATVDRYREAHAIADAHGRGEADTEQLRQAMLHYRALMSELLGRQER